MSQLTFQCLCWKITRADGVVMGFTAHDQPLILADGTYDPVAGFEASKLAATANADIDNLEFQAALSHATITLGDIVAGRFDGAQLDMVLVDWQNPSVQPVHLARFSIGDVDYSRDEIKADVLGETAAFDRGLVETLSPECRANLGDARCKVALRQWQHSARIVSVVGDSQFTITGLVPDDDYYAYGTVRFLTGENAGVDGRILQSSGQRISLEDPPPVPLHPGTLVQVTAGCDKRFATCAGKFANKNNFRGEPFVPGVDALLRYPGL